ncbi:hypothetical protein F5Y16DRAFT_181498 [Xylariaceae sp. FL0255]|nr:hypothetical protein F5Y16DRAFT_181498 [Xylariaceae sp. FL0255]
MTIVKSSAPTLESCCTCATLLSDVQRVSECEKPLPDDRWLECCPRVICGRCISHNRRFGTYCPYCQISLTTTALPPGLRDPPSYTASTGSTSCTKSAPPPPYSATATHHSTLDSKDEKSATVNDEPAQDILHFLNHAHDSVSSLSLRYGVPASVLRRANNITADHLILGRRTVIIPGEYYRGGVSLSPRPVEGEEEEARKAKLRRWMVACKVHEYDVALLYLEQADYDVHAATETYFADEEWERTHPVEAAGCGKGIVRGRVNTGRWSTSRRGR